MNEHPADGPVDEQREPDAEVAPAVQAAVGEDEQDELSIARERLAQVVDLPVEEHAAVYEDVHGRLQSALAEAGREREPDRAAGEGDPARDDGSQDR